MYVCDACSRLCQIICSRVRNASSTEVKQKILALFESMFVVLSMYLMYLFLWSLISFVLVNNASFVICFTGLFYSGATAGCGHGIDILH